ncbi:MAG: carboxypeptidase-like regulatory domain-containing protein [Aquaticitalea sp.]
MKKISFYFFIFALLFSGISTAQSVEINGKVMANDDEVEGIHVINKTESQYTITNSNGEFRIPVKLNDSIIFVAIKYNYKAVLVNSDNIKSKTLNVNLTELINQLDEVVIGKILTGNLLSDIENSDAKRDINFYDLGIPGYTGKPFTQSERRLNEAITGGGILPLNPILNYLSGRTKMLKNQIMLERLETCLDRIKSNLSETFFEYNRLEESLRTEFFFFCSEDEQFDTICRIKNDITTLEFLKVKLEDFKTNLQTKN